MHAKTRRTRRGRAAVAIFLTLWPLAGAAADRAPARMPLLRQTVRDQTIFRRAAYNYAPALIRDGKLYHVYWCGGVAGDYILHLQAADLTGPWTSTSIWHRFDVALKPTGSPKDFDGLHTCDPNVVKVQGTTYLYYTGEASKDAPGAIGVASSEDGIHFTRLNGGKPIVTAAMTDPRYAEKHHTYGAGQPAAVVVAPYVYLSFTDSTGAGTNAVNGAGQFMLRSPDPTFGTDVEEFGANGWEKRAPGVHMADHAYLESFGLDLAFDPPTGLLLAATDRVMGRTTLLALAPATLRTLARTDLPLAWREGPAIVTEADKSTPPRAACETLDLSILAAAGTSTDPRSWGSIGRSAGTFSLVALCSKKDE